MSGTATKRSTTQASFVAAFAALNRYDAARPFRSGCRGSSSTNAMTGAAAARSATSSPRAGAGEAEHVVDEAPLPDQAIGAEQQLAEAMKAIAALPASLKDTLVLRTIDEKSEAETAEILGISQKAVETRLYRARARLAEMLKKVWGMRPRCVFPIGPPSFLKLRQPNDFCSRPPPVPPRRGPRRRRRRIVSLAAGLGADDLAGDATDAADRVGRRHHAHHRPAVDDHRRAQVPAIGLNGTVPAPLIRLREGQRVRLNVINQLEEDSSIHWHGLILPANMDGVPGVSFPGIKPGSNYLYQFSVVQSGTYWYHSHSGLQEQEGHYGPIIIDPAGADPVAYDREHVIVLADHSALSPQAIFRRLKVNPGHFNFQRQTLAGLLSGKDQPLKDRLDWGQMRMDPADISDVTGSTYTYLVNGHGPMDNWTALFTPGERCGCGSSMRRR
jgi:RNA polymerase sigma factor (sigma-70 family)